MPNMQGLTRLTFLVALVLFGGAPARAEDYVLTVRDHQFMPPVLTIPANQKVKITVKNASPATVEFESSDLNREKIVPAGTEITIFVGPLGAGQYSYFDDFNRQTSGAIAVK
ncbi:MAG: cupredoxin domain-containing protein [Pseudomonadota bacterium]|nr:cupredoxin domain-containing protein [Pseudomonadota bacterium]